MHYFDNDDYDSIITQSDMLQRVHTKMQRLHKSLYTRLKKYGINLHPDPKVPGAVIQRSNSSPMLTEAMTLAYMRDSAEAAIVERVMGRETLSGDGEIKTLLHPVIELRLSGDYFVVELVISPEAWYDQQNFIGKLSIHQHRYSFYQLLQELQAEYYLGFWSGIMLHDMHLSTSKIPPAKILLEFVDTFAAGRDYFRLGTWYVRGDTRIQSERIEEEIFQRVRELYTMYEFILWTGNNNFHSFYKKMLVEV